MSTAFAFPRARSALLPLSERLESALRQTVNRATGPACPPRLREGLSLAVFAGGARLRPLLSLAVASAYGEGDAEPRLAVAVAVELVHCASLVHDDLPCFDDAPLRRGKPTVHVAFGVPTAVLVGDALIVLAFGALARGGSPGLVEILADATGPSSGIIAGQAWEAEAAVPIDEYHRAKTASLFEAAADLGARTAGADGVRWRSFGEVVGRAYQAADDLMDVLCDSSISGKPAMRDAVLQRPNLARAQGVAVARRRVEQLVSDASSSVPACPNDRAVRAWLDEFRAKIASTVPEGLNGSR